MEETRTVGLAAAKTQPYAVQVADCLDLAENAGHAFLDAVRKSMSQIRTAIGTMPINPDVLTAAEHIQCERSTCAARTPTVLSLLWPRTT